MPALNKLYQDYRDRAAFYIVYIQEAHPIDAWQVEDNLEDDVLVASTMTADERAKVAGLCVKNLGIELRRSSMNQTTALNVPTRDGPIASMSSTLPATSHTRAPPARSDSGRRKSRRRSSACSLPTDNRIGCDFALRPNQLPSTASADGPLVPQALTA